METTPLSLASGFYGGFRFPGHAMPGCMRDDLEAGVSEIVGALLLILIVSTAAIGLGSFVLQQQKVSQAQQALEHEKELERLEVRSIEPQDSPACATDSQGPSDWDCMVITLTSVSVEDAKLDGILLDGMSVTNANTDATGSQPSDIHFDRPESRLAMPSRATVNLLVVLQPSDFSGSFGPLSKSANVKVELLTDRGNHVERTFVLPDPLPIVRTQSFTSGGGTPTTTTSYILDGTGSSAVGEGSYLVSWTWTVQGGACGPATYAGPTVVAACVSAPATTYTVIFSVKDNHGMSASAPSFTITTPA
jgi:hypothetical protein